MLALRSELPKASWDGSAPTEEDTVLCGTCLAHQSFLEAWSVSQLSAQHQPSMRRKVEVKEINNELTLGKQTGFIPSGRGT